VDNSNDLVRRPFCPGAKGRTSQSRFADARDSFVDKFYHHASCRFAGFAPWRETNNSRKGARLAKAGIKRLPRTPRRPTFVFQNNFAQSLDSLSGNQYDKTKSKKPNITRRAANTQKGRH
jgi:hypothetical protein